MPQLEHAYIETGKVRYITRMFFSDEYTRMAVESLYCAGEQGKFWELHTWLFINVENWLYEDDLVSILAGPAASELGLDGTAMTSCLRQERYRELVEGFLQDAIDRGVSGTPSFLINDRPQRGAQPFSTFSQIIEEELAR